MKLPAPAGATAAMFTTTATGLAGTLQFVADPPCAVKPPELTHTLKSRDANDPSGPPATRVSTSRQGVTGVYARSVVGSPSALVCTRLIATGACAVSALAMALRSPSSDPARLAASN